MDKSQRDKNKVFFEPDAANIGTLCDSDVTKLILPGPTGHTTVINPAYLQLTHPSIRRSTP